jgi:MFS family permease
MTVTDSGPVQRTGQMRLLPVFSGLALAVFMFSVNQNMLSVALPTIVGDLDGADRILWVSTSYMIAATVTLPVYGKLGDVFGLRRLFLISLGTFVVACVLGSFSMSMAWLVAVRFVQGLGGGGLIVLAQSILAAVLPPDVRGRYMGIAGAVMVLSTVAGPVLGGLITEYWGWRWCFGVNVPFGVAAWFLAVRFIRLPEPTPTSTPPPDGTGGTVKPGRPRLDIAGMAVLAAAIAGIVLLTALGGHSVAWTHPVIIALAGPHGRWTCGARVHRATRAGSRPARIPGAQPQLPGCDGDRPDSVAGHVRASPPICRPTSRSCVAWTPPRRAWSCCR